MPTAEIGVPEALWAEGTFTVIGPITQDVSVPVGADSFTIKIPVDGFPVTLLKVIGCSVSISQDAGASFVEGVGISTDGTGGVRQIDMGTLEETFLPYTFCTQKIANPTNKERVLRVRFEPLIGCYTKVDIQFEGK